MRDFRPELRRRAVLAMLAAIAMPLIAGRATAEEPAQRVMVLGDSQAQGLAAGVQRYYRADRAHRVLDRSKISTGLNLRSSTDWPAQARTITTNDHADVAVAMFGANDRPPVRRAGQVAPDLLQRFAEIYAPRVTAVAQSFRNAGIPLIWVGHPIVRDTAFCEDMAILNAIFAERAVSEGAVFLSTWDAFKGADGEFAAYGRGVDGMTTHLRADDGVHMTPAGYDLITAMLVPLFDDIRLGQRPLASPFIKLPAQG